MDLAFVAKRLGGGGGTERDLVELASRLAAYGHRVTVYAHRLDAAPAGVASVRIPFGGPGELLRLWSLAALGPRLAARGGHDLVVSFARVLSQDVIRCGGGTHRAYLAALARDGAPLAAGLRRLRPVHRLNLALERRQYDSGRFERVLAISKAVAADVASTHGVPAGRIDVIYDGTDTERFHPRNREAQGAATRAEHGLGPGEPCLLFVGNGFRRKGLDRLIRAAALMKARTAKVLVVGADPGAEGYRRLAAAVGMGGRVIFAGRHPAPERFYAAADLFVLPARQEAFGNAVLEALASGAPVAVSACAGAAEILQGDLRDGISPAAEDEAGLAARLDAMLEAARDGRLGREARRTAEPYTLEANARRIEAMLAGILRGRRGPAAPGGET